MKKIIIILFTFPLLTSYSQTVCTAINFDDTEEPEESEYYIAVDQLVGVETLLWNNGKTLKVKFLGGSNYLQNKVMNYAKEWSKHCNINLKRVSSGNAEIRISFKNLGHWSMIGNFSESYSVNLNTFKSYYSSSGTTMNLELKDDSPDYDIKRVVLHEFGHALGFGHEHKHPEVNICWDRPAVYSYYAKKKWSREKVDHNILNKYTSTQTIHFKYDNKSIMHYPIPQEHTTCDYEVEWNYGLSSEDKRAIGHLYPFEKEAGNYRINDLVYGNRHWALVMSKGTSYTRQSRFTKTSFPKNSIDKYWNEGYYITDITYGNGLWSVVMSEGVGYTAQTWFTRSEPPYSSIEKYWDEGYDVTNITYGNDVWAVVMSKGVGYDKQIYFTRSNSPHNSIEKYWDEGYDVTNITYGNGVWGVVMSKGTGYGKQVYFTRSNFPHSSIEKYWDEGYNITNITYGNGVWGVVMSKGTGLMTQKWLTTKYFPTNQITDLWKK